MIIGIAVERTPRRKGRPISGGITWLTASRSTMTIPYDKNGFSYSYIQDYDGNVTLNSWES